MSDVHLGTCQVLSCLTLMCGRYTLIKLSELPGLFPWIETPAGLPSRYNIAPSQPVLVVPNDRPDQYDMLLWGLIPAWAKEPGIAHKLINARSETLAEKNTFKRSFKRRRCLIPADGFYEWKKSPDGKTRTPMYIRLKSGKPFAFAGLWDAWSSADGSQVRSCTIITTGPNELIGPLHDRMPVILPAEAHGKWLSPEAVPPEQLQPLLRPYPAEEMEAYEVSKVVNYPKNDTPQCISPC